MTTTSMAAGLITGVGRVDGPPVHDRRQRRDGEGRHLLSDDRQEAPARAGRSRARTVLPCIYLVDSRRRQSAATRPRSFPTASISAASSSTRPPCRRKASPRSPASWARAPPAAPMCRRCRTRSVIVRNQGTIFLGGPPLVKAATGEDVSAEELGGADVHAREVGRRRSLCAGRRACAGDRARHRQDLTAASRLTPWRSREPAPPLHDPAELYGIIPRTCARPMTCARSSPGSSTAPSSTSSSSFTAPRWSPASPISAGMPVGIIANNGVLFSESALKGAHFIELACQRRIPLLFLQNISGFMVGRKYEAGGIAKRRRQAGDRGRHAPACPRSR